MAKHTNGKRMNVYANLTHSRRRRKDQAARKRAEYLASLPKHPVKRLLYRLHPKRVAQYWFSKRGLFMALKIAGVAVLLMVVTIGALFAYYRKDLDQIRPGELAKRVQTTVTRYYDRNNNLLWEDRGSSNYRLVVKSDEITDYMKKATIAVEDKDFYHHGGISVAGLLRAAINNASSDSVQGGSTLTQQLVKQVFFAEDAQKRGLDGIPRKIKEVILAIEVERMYDKDQILNLYLNESPYGGRRNGVESAARTYFGKSAKQLTLAESALLAGIPNQPGLYDPYTAMKTADGRQALIKRQHKVLNDMAEQKYITQDQADAAKKVPILDTIKPVGDQYQNIKAPHFVQMVRSELEAKLGKKVVGQGGLIVKTTLDLRIQNKLEAEMDSMFNSSYPGIYGFNNGAATIEDVQTGQIVALLGSRNFRHPGFGQDNAAMSFIQPGSTIKPLVYAELFQNKGDTKLNFGSGSILSDVRTTFDGGYTPQNATGDFRGNINIRRSLNLSRNIPAIKAMSISGQEKTLETIRAMGDQYYCTQGNEKQVTLSSAIGGCGTRMVDHVNALASLARGGVYKPHSSILEVTNSSGDVLTKFKNEQKRIIDPQAAYIVNDILGDVASRRSLYGQSVTAESDAAGIRIAAKTGTSNLEVNGVVVPRDIWTVSYTPSLSAGVWLGNPDAKPLNPSAISAYASGVTDPVMVYATQLYEKEGKTKPNAWFQEPAGIQHINGELYPSYYNKKLATSNAKLTFDRVSKKRATECTPSGARIEVGVTKSIDPFSKNVIYIAPDGYDATKNDDAHSCGDAKPRVIGITVTDSQITARISKGKFALDKLSFLVNGEVVGTASINGSGSYTTLYDFKKSANVTVTVIDSGYYSDSASERYTSKNNGGGNGGGGQ